jgi:hypothetical protein
MVATGSAWLFTAWQPVYTLRWLALAVGVSIYLLNLLWQCLPFNYRAEEKLLLPYLGPGNVLTLARGILLAALAGFLFSPLPPRELAWLPGLIYTLAAIADQFDGYLARRSNQVTQLGEMLDLSLDGLSLDASVLVVQYGQCRMYLLVGRHASFRVHLAGTVGKAGLRAASQFHPSPFAGPRWD